MREVPQSLCLSLIQHFEGKDGAFEAIPTQDPAGNWEIGWGHKLPDANHPPIDILTANALAIADLGDFAAQLTSILGQSVIDDLTEGQWAALLDFTYNEGVGRFAASTLCHFVKAGSHALAADEFGKWVYGQVNGVETVLGGLVRRREAEKVLWLQ